MTPHAGRANVSESLAASKAGCLTAIPEVQLGQDIADVVLDRSFRDDQAVCYLAVCGAYAHFVEHLNLSRGEIASAIFLLTGQL